MRAGNGMQENRGAFQDLLDRWEEIDRDIKEEQCRQPSNSRLVYVPDCGHHVHLVRPDIVEIRWVKD